MRNILFSILLLVISCQLSSAQKNNNPFKNQETPRPENLISPHYPGEPGAFQNYLGEKIKSSEFKRLKSQKIYIYFVVEKDGSLSEYKFSRGVRKELKKVIKEALAKCEKWTPGQLNGKAVRVSHSVPISITVTD